MIAALCGRILLVLDILPDLGRREDVGGIEPVLASDALAALAVFVVRGVVEHKVDLSESS